MVQIKKDQCTGCTACTSICPNKSIVMKTDEYGFLYPQIGTSCLQCGLCETVCPIMNHEMPIQDMLVYAAYALDERIREQSSSGGILSIIANNIIDQGGCVYGAAYGEDFTVQHICVDDKKDLLLIRGSKYAQSNLGNSFTEIKKFLDDGRKVLFTGTPCQVAGLKKYLKKDYENLILIDFVCHSVPSPLIWRKYISYRAKIDNGGKLPCEINLRSKKTGWSMWKYSVSYKYSSGKRYSRKSGDDLYMKLFLEGYIDRPSCEKCVFKGFNRVSDITLGDFWGIWNIVPDMDDNKGTSLLLTHSFKGRQLLCNISPLIKCEEIELNEKLLLEYNPAISTTVSIPKSRKKIIDLALNDSFDTIEKSIEEKNTSKIKKIFRRVLHFRR